MARARVAGPRITVYRAAPATFTPTQITGLTAWYDASDTASITSSGSPAKVSQWNDKSGNANHLTQPTGSNQPVTGSRTQNSLNVIEFASTGAANSMTVSNYLSGLSAATTFIVKLNDVNTLSGSGIGLWRIGGGQDSWEPFIDNNIYEWFGTNTRKNWATTVATLLSAHIYGVVSAASDFRAYVNGTLDTSTGTNTVAFTESPIVIGENGTGGRYLDGWVAEWITYNSALGTTDRQSVETYLKAKWATP